MLFLLGVAVFMVSGDVFFVFQTGGFTVRLFQLLVAPLILQGVWKLFWNPRLLRYPIGFKALIVWSCFIVAFVPNTSYLPRSLFYAGWLVFNVLLVLGITIVIDTPKKLMLGLRWYLYSFVFSAGFGLLQISLPLLGFSGPLVRQWWFPETLARINGFTYEPSYYATYMITGWVMVDYLRSQKVLLVPRMNHVFWLISATIFLSSSRMGWLMMLGWLILRWFWRIQDKGLSVPWKKVAIAAVIPVVLISFVAVKFQLVPDDLMFLARGLGVLDRAESASTEGRYEVFQETLGVFYEHPIIGVSLGGVATAIGHLRHNDVTNQEEAKENEGQCTTAEVLAASGILGIVPYLLYMTRLMWAPLRSTDHSELGLIVKALGWSFIFLILTLQFNQTILRSYVWLHIGILSAAYRVFIFAAPNGRSVRLLTQEMP